MDVTYVDVSECTSKTVGSLAGGLRLNLAIYLLPLYLIPLGFLLGEPAMEGDEPWLKVVLVLAVVLPVAAVLAIALRRRVSRKARRVELAALGLTLHQVRHALAELRRDLDRNAGRSRSGAAIGAAWRGLTRADRARAKARLLRLCAAGLVLAAVFAFAAVVGLAQKHWQQGEEPWYVVVALYLVVPGLLLVFVRDHGGRLWSRAKAIAHPTTQLAREADPRRPILLLRSFADDTVNVEAEMTLPLDQPHITALEDAVGRQIRRFGPFIAVAEPGKGVTSGAARDWLNDQDWKTTVQGWMDEALLVVLFAGTTEGIQWEVRQAVARNCATKLVVILPDGPQLEQRWQKVCRAFAGTRWHAPMLGADLRFVLAATFGTKGELMLFASRARATGDYEAAVELATFAMLCRGASAAGPV